MSGNVTIKKGDIFQSHMQTIVNTVNCVGVMGKGLALEFKRRFPDMFKDYVKRCERGELKLGRPHLYRSLVLPWILNFPTKGHWRGVSRLEDIVEGLHYLKSHYREWGIESIAFPALGCSHGQLEWRVVGPTMYRHLRELDIPVELYVPVNESVEAFEKLLAGEAAPTNDALARVKPAWVALAAILAELENEPYRHPVGRTMFQKISYFATMEGLPTELVYRRGSYGPFADGAKGMLTRLVNHGLVEERELGRMFEVRVGPTYEDTCKQMAGELQAWQPIIRKVADLFMRANTSQAEIMATVHMAARELGSRIKRTPTVIEVTDEVMAWKQKRRPPLSRSEVERTIGILAMLKWIEVEAEESWAIEEPELA